MAVEDFVIVPYNKRSKGFRALVAALGLKLKRPQDFEKLVVDHQYANGSGKPLKKRPFLINWGSGNIPAWMYSNSDKVLNAQQAVNNCRNKVRFFDLVKDKARVPEYTKDIAQAMAWVEEGKSVMGRKETGSCGTDIVFYEDDPGAFQASDFWVLYKKKKSEFRVHIFGGNVISTQMKAIRTTDEMGQPIPAGTVNFRIRNHKNGFIFKRNDLVVPPDVMTQAVKAMAAVPGLDFGAVDVIYNAHEDRAYVLEINTAPGLEGTTLDDYAKAIKSLA